MIDNIEDIKRLSISALVSDEILMGILVLKGGNALNIAYDISSRGSLDIDFSMQGDFSEKERNRLKNQLNGILLEEFSKSGYHIFDVEFEEKPKNIAEELQDFWGGYLLNFKVIKKELYNRYKGDQEAVRRHAIPVGKRNSTKVKIDISKYEFVGRSKKMELEGAIVQVYSPEMIVVEKLRAICQQLPNYKKVIPTMRSSPRARDFYDIYTLCDHFKLDFGLPENSELIQVIFDAKRVPVDFIRKIENERDFHKQDWESVVQTVSQDIELKSFDFYFDYVLDIFYGKTMV